MSNSFLCRTCLSFSNKTHDLRNTQLQETFEKLTNKKLKAFGSVSICYICYAQLQKCRRFADMSWKSGMLLSELSNKGVEITQDTVTRLKGKSSYSITPIDYYYNGTRDALEALVKEDPVIEYGVVVKVEKLEIQDSDVHLNPTVVKALKTEPAFIVDEVVVKEELEEMWFEENIDIEGEVTIYDSGVVSESDLMRYEDEYVDIENISVNDKENLPKTKIPNDKLHTAEGKLPKHTKTDIKNQIYTCDICDAIFFLKSRIIEHLRNHSQVSYTCMLCYKTFLKERYLKEHIKVHTGEKPFICHQCGKQFTDKSSLNRHIKIHSFRNSALKTHDCEICNKKFIRRPHLKSHLISHTGFKAYTCNVCKNSFTQKGSLKGHMRIHTGEKTHYCSECNKGFYRKGHLRQHMSVHSGERLFSCDRCAYRFTTKIKLRQHTCKLKVRPHYSLVFNSSPKR